MASGGTVRNPIKAILAGSALIALARATSQFVQIAIFVAAARSLAPADFGVYAFVSAIAVLGAVAAQGGWAGFILSTRNELQDGSQEEAGHSGSDATRQALSLVVLSGLAASLVGMTVSLAVPSDAEGTRRILFLLFAGWVLVATCAEGWFAVLLRQGRAVAAATCQIAAEALGLVVVLWLLRSGEGVLALAYGRLVAQGLQFTGTLALSRTLPSRRLTRAVTAEAAIYSAHLLTTRVVGTLRGSLGTFVVGGLLGAEAVGFFRLAQRLVGAAYEIVCESALVVAWMVLRRAVAPYATPGDHRAQAALQRAMEQLVPLLLGVAAPIFVGLSLTAGDLFAALLGDVWRPAGPIASVLSIASLLMVPASLSEPIFSLTGKIRLLPRLSLIYAATSACMIVPAGFLGLDAIVWVHLGLGAAGLALWTTVQQRALGLNWWRIAKRSAILLPLLAGMAAAAILLRHFAIGLEANAWTTFTLTAIPAGGLYLGALVTVRAEVRGLAARALR